MNRGFEYEETIGRRGGGQTVLAYLASRYGHTPAEGWLGHIGGGRVLLDGLPASPAEILRPGQRLTWVRPPWEEPEVPLSFAVLFEDDDLLAVAKPRGLPTLPGGGFLEHTLLTLVRRRRPGASPMHRLGRGTSGVVLFALTAGAARSVSEAWRERRVTKDYRALVEGEPAAGSFLVEAPIGPMPHPSLGLVHAANPSGKASRSRVTVLERRGATSLVEVRIETGRPHQIRIHMAACGHPLLGDPLYARGGGFRGGALPGDTGYHLHAFRLALPHPTEGEILEVECRPPALLRVGGT